MTSVAVFDELRTIAFSSISTTYTNFGPPLNRPARFLKINNKTDADLIISVRFGRDNIFISSLSFSVYDLQSNMNQNRDDSYVIAAQTQFLVKGITVPTTGSAYIELLIQ